MSDIPARILAALHAEIIKRGGDPNSLKAAAIPDPLPDRDKLERMLGRKLSELTQAQYERLVKLLGDPPSLSNVPAAYWATANDELMAVMRPTLQRIYLDQATAFLGAQSIGVDWALVNQAAADWASRYTFDLVSGINQTTQTALQNALSKYYEAGQTIGELEQNIAPLFGQTRAEMISVTEITRASTQGEVDVVAQITRDNPSIQAVPVWQTNRDDRVCPICGPRNGKRQGDGWEDLPPAHIRCRCWINHKVSVNGR